MKVLISSRSFGKKGSDAIDILKENGLEPIMNPKGKKLSEQEILDIIEDSVGIIAGTEKISKKIITYNNNLRVISRYGIGMDNVDLQTAKENNILVYNTPNSPKTAVAELTLCLILNLLKKINIMDNSTKKNLWKPEYGYLLSNKTVGIIGLGRIGRQLVEFLKPFNVKILSFDVVKDEKYASKNNINYVDLNDLLKKSDIISIHIPLTDQTRYLIGEKQLELMKNTSILINTARGGIIDEKTLYNSLKNKKIAGAAIDVFENEPDTGLLKTLSNCILTPHIGTYTIETRKNMEIEAVNNLIEGLKKQHLI